MLHILLIMSSFWELVEPCGMPQVIVRDLEELPPSHRLVVFHADMIWLINQELIYLFHIAQVFLTRGHEIHNRRHWPDQETLPH